MSHYRRVQLQWEHFLHRTNYFRMVSGGRQLDTFIIYSDRLSLYRFQVRASSVPPPRELPTAPLIQRQRRGSIAPGAPASNVSSRLREREAEFARQVNNLQTKFSGLQESFTAASRCITLLGLLLIIRVGEDTFEMYLRYRYRYTRGCIFCIFQILRYRYH